MDGGKTLFEGTPGFRIDYFSTRLENQPDLEHYHDSCEIAYFIRADLKMFLKNRQYRVGDGEILFIGANEIHKWVYPPMEYQRYVINFKESYIGDVLQALGAAGILAGIKGYEVAKAKLNRRQQYEFETVCKELLAARVKRQETAGPKAVALLKLKLAQLLIMLDEALGQSQAEGSPGRSDRRVQTVIDYIDANYMNPISLELLAKEFFLSKYYLLHAFKKATGFTIVEYLQLRRIIEAQRLLKDTADPVTDICFACGFNNIQHFCRVFKKIARSSPGKYRSRNRRRPPTDERP